MKNFQNIESIYIQNTSSPVYSMLADYYYQKKQFNHVVSVCKAGLKVNADDMGGLYVYAKALIMLGQFQLAEQKLKKIIKLNKYNPQACLLLISVMEHLDRSPKSIGKYVGIMNMLFENHPNVKSLNDKYPNNATINKDNIAANIIKVESIPPDQFIKNAQLATKTMYTVLLAQKKYQEALDVLNVLRLTKGVDIAFVDKEINKIKNKLK